MTGKIFNIQESGDLVEMNESAFANEDDFQLLLERYPDLLAGDQIRGDDPRRWLLVRREMGISDQKDGSDRWSLDHLFIDQEGIPTLVEVKRSSDTRLRREVVGQVLDYAANAVVHWSIEQIQMEYERQCESDKVDPGERLKEFIGDEQEHDSFWQQVKTNLQAGRVRLLFVADVIPPELRRIVEFLNEQMDPAEVLAVEIRQFVGGGIKTLVPRVLGQTAEAEARKGTGKKVVRKRPLSESELQEIAKANGVGELYASLVRRIRPLFDYCGTTLSNISFNVKISSLKTTGVALTMVPGDSDQRKGLRFGIYVDRVAERFKLEESQIFSVLPELEKGGWGPKYFEGFAPPESGLSKLIELLESADRAIKQPT